MARMYQRAPRTCSKNEANALVSLLALYLAYILCMHEYISTALVNDQQRTYMASEYVD
jgi:hypothetical protein